MRRIDLDHVLLSPEAVSAWHAAAKRAAKIAHALGIDPKSIPDERAGVLRNGDLKIYVQINGVEVSMIVPRSQWQERLPRN